MFGEPVVTAEVAALNYRLNKVMSLSVGDDITLNYFHCNLLLSGVRFFLLK